ncbi:hypothetical protein ABZ137_21615 [Streptomyces bobili]|uniref:hypothetical protein n=1 Tax=Streptomyces bobili TaxID=67280 RepID=UPI0033A99EC9
MQVTEVETRGRQVNAVITLIAKGRIPDGTVLEYRPYSKPERRDMTEWLAEDPKRSRATWSNDADRYALQWHADEEWYSPSGLAREMRRLASGVSSSVQGTIRWFVPGEGSLDELALAVRLEEGLDTGTSRPAADPGADAGCPPERRSSRSAAGLLSKADIGSIVSGPLYARAAPHDGGPAA